MGGGAGGGREMEQGEGLAGEWEQLFSYVTHCINLIHIAINFHTNIPYVTWLYGLHKNRLKKLNRDITPNNKSCN